MNLALFRQLGQILGVPIGNTGDVLVSNGPDVEPTFQAVAAATSIANAGTSIAIAGDGTITITPVGAGGLQWTIFPDGSVSLVFGPGVAAGLSSSSAGLNVSAPDLGSSIFIGDAITIGLSASRKFQVVGLPTADPGSHDGAVWNSAGTLKIST